MPSDPRHLALLAENAELRAELVRLRGTMERLENLMKSAPGAAGEGQQQHFQATEFGWSFRAFAAALGTRRKRGGQPGRKGMMLPEASENCVVPVPLARCPHCRTAIPQDRITVSQTRRDRLQKEGSGQDLGHPFHSNAPRSTPAASRVKGREAASRPWL